MPRRIVIMMDPDKRESLLNSGVIPAGMFHPFDANAAGDSEGLSIWPYALNYDPPVDPRSQTLASLLGLPESTGDESMMSDVAIGHLFDSMMLHVVFLDGSEERTVGRRMSSFESLTSILDWGDRLKAAVSDRFSEVQGIGIRHILVIVASGGQVVTDEESVKRLNACIEPGSCLQTCFFLDYNLGVESSDRIYHSKHVWPTMLGRLILRLMLKNAQRGGQGQDDAVLRPGFHVWRAKEFVFSYPKHELKAMWLKQLRHIYTDLDSALAENSDKDSADVKSSSDGLKFPELPKPQSIYEGRSWTDFPVEEYAEKINDDKRWSSSFAQLKDSVKRLKVSCRTSEWVVRITSVFGNVGKSPANVFAELKSLSKRLEPNQDLDVPASDPVGQWKSVTRVEEERKAAKDILVKASEDFSEMQDHYVPKLWGLAAVVAVTLFCGFSIGRLVAAINAPDWFSLLLGGCVLLGAMAGWRLVSFFHVRAGSEALKHLQGIGDSVHELMNRRHEQSFCTMRSSWRRRVASEDRNVSAVLQRLLTRVARIMNVELQTPTVEVFFDDKEEKKPDEGELSFAEKQIADFRKETTFVEDLGEVKMDDGDFESAQQRIKDFFKPERTLPDDDSFATFWANLCRRVDEAHLGNLPATVLIPAFRNYMQKVCDSVTESLKQDVLSKASLDEMPNTLQSVGEQSGFSFASAQISISQIEGNPYNELFVSDRYADEVERRMKGETSEPIVRKSPLFNRLPHYALYFQDMVVKPKLGNDGRLAF